LIGSTPASDRYRPLFMLAVALLLLSCSTDERPPAESSKSQTDGITFFDVGADTVFSDALRERLRKSLGPDAIEYRGTMNLAFNEKGFLQRHFAGLAQLNQRLNTPPGERVEHDTVKLVYRYAARENLPFSYVELVFSNSTGKPLYIQIRSRKDLADIIQTLEAKYGPPQAIDQPADAGRYFFWTDRGDVLLVAIVPTWRGDQESRMVIYYVDNLEKLIAAEEKERREKEEARRRAGEKIF
ncbi:MAG: hypothetical protein WAO07_12610, partial [Desulfobacterales bacterium]